MSDTCTLPEQILFIESWLKQWERYGPTGADSPVRMAKNVISTLRKAGEGERLRGVLQDLKARLIEVNVGIEMGNIDTELVATIDCALNTSPDTPTSLASNEQDTLDRAIAYFAAHDRNDGIIFHNDASVRETLTLLRELKELRGARETNGDVKDALAWLLHWQNARSKLEELRWTGRGHAPERVADTIDTLCKERWPAERTPDGTQKTGGG